MSYLIAGPVLVIALMLQLAIFSQLPLLYGTADVMLLVLLAWALQERSSNAWFWALIGGGLVSVISAMPFGTPLIVYLVLALIMRTVSRRVMEFPVLGMLIATLGATFFQHMVEIVVLFVDGRSMPFEQSLVLVTMPSMLLNLLFSLPVYALMTELAHWVYPVEVQI
jgi:rod shape-determining protein MreD